MTGHLPAEKATNAATDQADGTLVGLDGAGLLEDSFHWPAPSQAVVGEWGGYGRSPGGVIVLLSREATWLISGRMFVVKRGGEAL